MQYLQNISMFCLEINNKLLLFEEPVLDSSSFTLFYNVTYIMANIKLYFLPVFDHLHIFPFVPWYHIELFSLYHYVPLSQL